KTADRLLKRLLSENSAQLDKHEKERVSQQEPSCSKDAVEIEAGKGANDDPLLAGQDIEELRDNSTEQGTFSTLDVNMEFKSFEVSLEITENLDKLYKALLSVKPTSVKSERAVSAVGMYLTKPR
ncbi:hypothetical protein SK128_025062, partial [Halocaridina rubra]